MNKYLTHYRSLPPGIKKLFLLGNVMAVLVALPLFASLLISQNFDIRNHAQSITPEAISSQQNLGIPLILKIALGALILSLILIVIGIKKSRSVVK